MAFANTTASDNDLLRIDVPGHKLEVVDGEIRMSPAGLFHEEVGSLLIYHLWHHVRPQRLGRVFGSSAGFRLTPDDLRSPDVCFVSSDRLPLSEPTPRGFGHFAPDIVAEVLSPWDQAPKVREKAQEYLRTGVRLVWVIDPETRTATIDRPGAPTRAVSSDGSLDGEDVLPGFAVPLAALFEV